MENLNSHVFEQHLKDSLNQNKQLTEEYKNSLLGLIPYIYSRMERIYGIELPTEYLLEKLKTIQIEESSEIVQPFPYEYSSTQNKVTMKKTIQDPQNLFCQTILEMAIVPEPNKGIDNQHNMAIKRGILEICANYIVGNYGASGYYEDEQIAVQLMDVIAEGKIQESFLTGNQVGFEKIIKENNFASIRGFMNFNRTHRDYMRPNTKVTSDIRSYLGDIEERLIVHFFHQPLEKVKNQIEMFETNLITEPNVMGNPSLYPNLQELKNKFVQMKHQMYITQGENLQLKQLYNQQTPISVPPKMPFEESKEIIQYEEVAEKSRSIS